MEVLAIVPARGGSKGLKDKNILPLAGHPLISYSIEAARQVPEITRCIVSTDSQAIAEVALQYHAEVPFMRPEAFAQDTSKDLEVFQHALEWLETNESYIPDLVVHLRPTSPIRQVADMSNCIRQMQVHPEADSLRIITPSPCNPYKMWQLDGDFMEPILTIDGLSEAYNRPRQELPPTYWQIGYLDVIRPSVIKAGSMSGKKILPFVVDQAYAVDIDTLENLQTAERVIQQLKAIRFA